MLSYVDLIVIRSQFEIKIYHSRVNEKYQSYPKNTAIELKGNGDRRSNPEPESFRPNFRRQHRNS